MINISIIIRTLNESIYLPILLDRLSRDHLALQSEVIVVDSGSTDLTPQIARNHGARVLNIKRDEFSFGRSLNIGCAEARGEILVFISGHCVPASAEWLSLLTAPLLNGTAAYSYGRQIGGPKTLFSEHLVFNKYFPPSREEAQDGCFCSNANAALLKSCWKHNRFREDLTGLEDMELAKRILTGGGEVHYLPEAVVYHYHHETWQQIKRRYEREALALRHILPEIHVNLMDSIGFFFAGVFGDARKALSQRRLLRVTREILTFRFLQYYGAWRGYQSHMRWSRTLRERYFYPSSTKNNTFLGLE